MEPIAVGELFMPLEVDGETVDVPPRHLELVSDPEDPSRFTAFMSRHKKEAILLGSVTTAAILTGVAAIGYAKKKK